MTRDERPAPTVFHAGVVVPMELCAELAAALEQYVQLLPASKRQGALSRPVVAVLRASKDAAAVWALQQHRQQAWSTPTPVTPVVLGTPQLAPESTVEEITTGNAEGITGLSAEWWRRLAVRGTIRGRQDGRGTWWLWKSDVVGYSRQETRSDRHPRHHRTDRPERQAG